MTCKTIYEHIRDHVLNINQPTFEELKKTQWSSEFEKLMRNRLILGGWRYGRLKSYGSSNYDVTSSIKKRLEIYIKTKNTEMLVDIANLCLVEFVNSKHPNKHFKSNDDSKHTSLKF